MSELTCTFEQFKAMAREFHEAAPTLTIDELHSAWKCLSLGYLNMSEPMWQRSASIVLNMEMRTYLKREAEIMEDEYSTPKAAPSEGSDETDWYHGMTEKHFDRAVQKAIQRDRASRAAAPKAAPGGGQPYCERCCGSGEDPAGYYDQSRGDAGSTFGGPCRECNGTGAAPQQEAQEPAFVDVSLRTAIAKAVYQQVRVEFDYKLGSWTALDADEQQRIVDSIRGLYTAPQPAPAPLSRDQIREVFMAHGFTIKECQTDLKQYVYDAAYALLRAALAAQGVK